MRKLIFSNFLTLDGYYESAGKTFDRFFDYWHEDYGANEAFDCSGPEGHEPVPMGPSMLCSDIDKCWRRQLGVQAGDELGSRSSAAPRCRPRDRRWGRR
jgi:hypothetical protein